MSPFFRSLLVPSLREYSWEPHVREVRDWQAARMRQEGGLGVLDNVDRIFRTLMLVNPIAHPLNVAASWAYEKGIQGVMPQRIWSTVKTGIKATRAVVSQNEDYLKALDAGAPLQSYRESMGQITDMFFKQLADDVESKNADARVPMRFTRRSPTLMILAPQLHVDTFVSSLVCIDKSHTA